MLLWEGEPIPDGLDKVDEIERAVESHGDLIERALRRNFSPNGVLRNIMIDTVVVSNQTLKQIRTRCCYINVVSRHTAQRKSHFLGGR